MKSFTYCLLLLAFLGCNSKPKPDDTSTKMDFPTALAEVVKLRDQIRDGFQAGDIDAAHGPLHDVGFKIEALNTLANESQLSQDDIASIKSSADSLFEAFSRIDDTLHGREGSLYEDEANVIDEAIAKLQSIAQKI